MNISSFWVYGEFNVEFFFFFKVLFADFFKVSPKKQSFLYKVMHFNIFYEILHYKSYFALKFMQKDS